MIIILPPHPPHTFQEWPVSPAPTWSSAQQVAGTRWYYIGDSNDDHDDDYNGGLKARTRRSWLWLLRQDKAEGKMMNVSTDHFESWSTHLIFFWKPGCEQFPRARVQVSSSSLWIAWPCPQVTSSVNRLDVADEDSYSILVPIGQCWQAPMMDEVWLSF